MSKDSR